jgi:AraC-like DNA-binding protein
MKFVEEVFVVILLLGTIQGFIISGLLFFAKKRVLSKRLLATMIFLMTLACLNLFLAYQHWFRITGIALLMMDVIPLVIMMPIGPLLYFYVQSCMDPDFVLQRKDRIHFYPVIIDCGAQLIALTFIVGVLSGLLANKAQPWGIAIDTYNVYSDIPRWVSLTTYLCFSVRYLQALKKETPTVVSEPVYKWSYELIKALGCFQVLWLIYLVPYVIPAYTDKVLDMVDWYPLYIPMVFLIYWLGLKGLLMIPQTELVVLPQQEPPARIAPVALSSEIITATVPVLLKAMEDDQLYLDPNLNLALLVQHTGIPQKTISAVLNQHLNKSFNEFVNEYRIAYFKLKILDPRQDNLTILGVAFDAGFNSQATFQRAFKNVVGMSPREFLAQELKKTDKS